MTKGSIRAAELFAKLASIEHLHSLRAAELDSLCKVLSELTVPPVLVEITRRIAGEPIGLLWLTPENELMQEKILPGDDPSDIEYEHGMRHLLTAGSRKRRILLACLARMHADARYLILSLLDGKPVSVPGHLVGHVKLRLDGRAVVESLPDTYDLVTPGILMLLRERRFPFGRCAKCTAIFVQPSRGKPRRFCSSRCKERGVPSAAKRGAYIKAYRAKKRAQDLRDTERVIAGAEKIHIFPKMQRQFPNKTRREILYLLRRATEVGRKGQAKRAF